MQQTGLVKGEIPFVTHFGRVVLEPSDEVRRHMDASVYEIYFVESGRGFVRFNDDTKEEFLLSSGSFFVTIPRLQHEILNNSTEPLVFIVFAGAE
jgi:mannose-6-phosphate isomerase-like protein (cupin superfamily)